MFSGVSQHGFPINTTIENNNATIVQSFFPVSMLKIYLGAIVVVIVR